MGLSSGAWLGGVRTALLMQSSGVGRSAVALLTEMGVETVRADTPADVSPAVKNVLARASGANAMTAVLIAQQVVGVKRFEEGPR